MFVMSFKLSTLKIAAVLIALGIIIAVAAWPRGEAAVPAGRTYAGISTNEKRVSFLESYGWKVDTNPVEVVEVTIPQTFNDVYQNYNAIQKKQGLDLQKYEGKRVKRWTYRITNYPGATGEIHANLLIYNNKVIGGDVSSVALNGFMHGFALTGTASNPTTGAEPQQADITGGIFSQTEN